MKRDRSRGELIRAAPVQTEMARNDFLREAVDLLSLSDAVHLRLTGETTDPEYLISRLPFDRFRLDQIEEYSEEPPSQITSYLVGRDALLTRLDSILFLFLEVRDGADRIYYRDLLLSPSG